MAAVLADFGLQRGPLAAARAFLVAAWHPEDAPYEEDYHEKHDDDRDRHPNLASVGFKPGTERTIAARIGRVARGMPIAVIRTLGGEPPGGGGDQSRAGDDEAERDHPSMIATGPVPIGSRKTKMPPTIAVRLAATAVSAMTSPLSRGFPRSTVERPA